MQVELKHLVPYLPYGLRCTNIDKPINAIQMDLMVTLGLFRYKPILRPLSDLTKEIEVNGEKFVPIDRINEYDETTMNYSLSFYTDCTLRLPYYVIQYLFEWHFDVFALISQGLAIDINTL